MDSIESWLFSPGLAAACFAGSIQMICEHLAMPRGRSYQVTVAIWLGTYIMAGGHTF